VNRGDQAPRDRVFAFPSAEGYPLARPRRERLPPGWTPAKRSPCVTIGDRTGAETAP